MFEYKILNIFTVKILIISCLALGSVRVVLPKEQGLSLVKPAEKSEILKEFYFLLVIF